MHLHVKKLKIDIFTYYPLHVKLSSKFLGSLPREWEITHSPPSSFFFQKSVPPSSKGGDEIVLTEYFCKYFPSRTTCCCLLLLSQKEKIKIKSSTQPEIP